MLHLVIAAGDVVKAAKALGFGVGMGLGSLGAGIGIGTVFASLIQ